VCDSQDGRWYVAPDETLADRVRGLHARAASSRAVVEAHDLSEVGHLDIVSELADGRMASSDETVRVGLDALPVSLLS
jgi:hypothetical protein